MTSLTLFPEYFVLKKDSQTFYCFGAQHTYEPNDEQINAVESLWREFLSISKDQKKVVLIEGGLRPSFISKEEAILNDGETGFLSWLAEKEHVPAMTAEPDEKQERVELLKRFSKEEIQLYYFLRWIYQWSNLLSKPSFQEYIDHCLELDKRSSGWDSFDFSYSNMKSIFREKLNMDFDENDSEFLYSAVNPVDERYVTNKIAKASGEIRDAAIMDNVIRLWNGGHSVFSVYGDGHITAFIKRIQKDLNVEEIKKAAGA